MHRYVKRNVSRGQKKKKTTRNRTEGERQGRTGRGIVFFTGGVSFSVRVALCLCVPRNST